MPNEQSGKVTEPASNSKEAAKKTKSERAFEDAVKAYKKWLAKNPKDDNAYYYLGRTYAKLMQDDDAEEAFQEAVKLKPEDSEYQTELGSILIKLAKYSEAIKPLKRRSSSTLQRPCRRSAGGRGSGQKRVDYVSTDKTRTWPSTEKSRTRILIRTPSSNSAMPSNSTSPRPPEGEH
ncbi:MAG: tetratricopeptide repeat protein [Acidobacteria bacterium]|nr:tetratricopeptide repeat protein [Acidobacteriota bacterium]